MEAVKTSPPVSTTRASPEWRCQPGQFRHRAWPHALLAAPTSWVAGSHGEPQQSGGENPLTGRAGALLGLRLGHMHADPGPVREPLTWREASAAEFSGRRQGAGEPAWPSTMADTSPVFRLAVRPPTAQRNRAPGRRSPGRDPRNGSTDRLADVSRPQCARRWRGSTSATTATAQATGCPAPGGSTGSRSKRRINSAPARGPG